MKGPLAEALPAVASALEPSNVADMEPDTMAKPTDRSRASSTHTSSHYFAKALPATEGGYKGQYGAPGLLPSLVRTANGSVAVYQTEFEAELAAARVMIDVMNSRSNSLQKGKSEHYRKLTPAEFAILLDGAGVGPKLLAYIKGTDPARVLRWLEDPEQGIPHDIRVLLEIFRAFPETIELAEAVTDAVATRKLKDQDDSNQR